MVVRLIACPYRSGITMHLQLQLQSRLDTSEVAMAIIIIATAIVALAVIKHRQVAIV